MTLNGIRAYALNGREWLFFLKNHFKQMRARQTRSRVRSILAPSNKKITYE